MIVVRNVLVTLCAFRRFCSRKVLLGAQKLGCDYVRFGWDGRKYEELPFFDW